MLDSYNTRRYTHMWCYILSGGSRANVVLMVQYIRAIRVNRPPTDNTTTTARAATTRAAKDLWWHWRHTERNEDTICGCARQLSRFVCGWTIITQHLKRHCRQICDMLCAPILKYCWCMLCVIFWSNYFRHICIRRRFRVLCVFFSVLIDFETLV